MFLDPFTLVALLWSLPTTTNISIGVVESTQELVSRLASKCGLQRIGIELQKL